MTRAERAIPANIMMTTPEGPANLEVTLDAVYVLDGNGAGLVTHTNHCRHSNLVSINDAFPELIQSHARQARIDRLLEFAKSGPDVVSPDAVLTELKTAFRDHENFPRSICRHTNDDHPTGFWQTVFSVIIEPESQRMHITRGTPCSHPYETYFLI